jgi:hypothetical protein
MISTSLAQARDGNDDKQNSQMQVRIHVANEQVLPVVSNRSYSVWLDNH